jgi:signal transduction histidine kinase
MSLARDIHDELGHLLTVIKIEIEDLVAPVNKLKKSYSNKLNPVIDLVDAAIDSVRTIATKLRPEVLDYFGLIPAMEWQIQQFQIRNKIDLKHDFEIKDFPFSKNESTAIFRIFQEMLTNILRHSKATNIEMYFKRENEHIMLKVKDNGTGFDMSKMAHEYSFGLLGMKERAISIGGELIVDSIPGRGTTVILLLPWKNSGENRNH